MVVSGDRDVYQLVGDGVRVMTTSRGVTDTKIYDREGVVERYGVPPELVPDLIGLKGDTSDNIPGVPGIGDKTAAQLLQQFGSLEAVLDSVDEISGAKRKENLTEHADDARHLEAAGDAAATTSTCRLDVSEDARRQPDRSRLRDVAAEFELRAVIAAARRGVRRGRPGPRRRGDARGRGRGGHVRRPAPRAGGDRGRRRDAGPATDGERVVAGDAHDLAAARRSAPRAAAARATTPRRRAAAAAPACSPSRRPAASSSSTTRWSPPTCIDPARRVYDLAELAADAGLAARARPEAGRRAR